MKSAPDLYRCEPYCATKQLKSFENYEDNRAMERIYFLAERCRMNAGDLLTLAREVAANAGVRSIEDLNGIQREALLSFLEILLAPADVEQYVSAA